MSLKKLIDFFPTPRYLKFSYVGIDISSDHIRYSELVKSGGKLKLGRYGDVKFEKTDDIFSNEDLKQKLKTLRKEKGIEFIKATLPEEKTYLFATTVESRDLDKARSEIEFHLEENVPLSGSEALFDFYLLPQENNTNQAVVSVVPINTVLQYITLFNDAGMTPVSFMVESGALSRAIIPKGTDETHLIINLSEEKTVLAVSYRGYVEFTSTLSFGGGIITDVIKRTMSLGDEEARALKFSKGLTKGVDNEFLSSIANAASVLRDEIQKVVMFWKKQSGNEKKIIHKVIVSGVEASVPGLPEYLSGALGLKVTTADIWVNIPYYKNSVPPIEFKDSLSFGSSLGLVLSN